MTAVLLQRAFGGQRLHRGKPPAASDHRVAPGAIRAGFHGAGNQVLEQPVGSDRGLELGEGRSIGRRLAHIAGREFELGQRDVADIAFGVVHVGLRDCVNAEPGGDTLFGIRPRPPLAQALALMRADAVKRRSWLGLLHGELAFWVGRIDGWFALRPGRNALRIGRACAHTQLLSGRFSATERRNRPPIPLAAGAAFRRRGPSLGQRVSARKSLGHSPPGPAPAASGRSGTARSCDQASLAPFGTRPVSENRHYAE